MQRTVISKKETIFVPPRGYRRTVYNVHANDGLGVKNLLLPGLFPAFPAINKFANGWDVILLIDNLNTFPNL